MKLIIVRFAFAFVSLCTLIQPAFCGPLDDHYLAAFGVQNAAVSGSALQKAILLQAADTGETPQCGTPLKHGLQRDWNSLEPATQKVLAKQLAAPVLSGEATFPSAGGHFLIHYTTSGTDAASLAWVQTVAQTFEDVAAAYLARGWNLAPTVNGARYDVYLRDLAPQRLYGQTTSTQATSGPYSHSAASYLEIDNDFLDSVYQNALHGSLTASQKALLSLQITAAHEYHHAIQYGYNYYFDIWYAEATSTWFEDELYDNANQLYNYLTSSMFNTNLSLDITADISTGGGYGRWLFNRHLTEAHATQPIVRNFWERLAATQPSGNNDIPMSPIIDAVLQTSGSSLGTDLLGYASKLYTEAWTTHLTETALIPAVAMSGTFSSLPITITSTPSPAVTLPHHSFAFFKLLPPTASPATLNITLTRDNGISVVAFTKTNNIITPFSPNTGTNLIVIPGFNMASEVVLLVTNTTSSDNLFAGFSSDGSLIQYALPGTTISTVPSSTPPSVTLTWPTVAGATSYQIYRSSTYSTELTPFVTTSATSYTDTNVLNDHNYYYSIMPIKSAGLTGPVSQVTIAKVPTANTSTSGGGSGGASSGGGGGGGCFIATAAYGSYLHPQVQVLRDFRDRYLLTNVPGRAFVALYYRVSPPLADFIADHELLRMVTRVVLTPVVVAVAHPVLAGVSLLLAGGLLLHRPFRRRFQACEVND